MVKNHKKSVYVHLHQESMFVLPVANLSTLYIEIKAIFMWQLIFKTMYYEHSYIILSMYKYIVFDTFFVFVASSITISS